MLVGGLCRPLESCLMTAEPAPGTAGDPSDRSDTRMNRRTMWQPRTLPQTGQTAPPGQSAGHGAHGDGCRSSEPELLRLTVLLSDLCPGDSGFENERVGARGGRRPTHLLRLSRSHCAVGHRGGGGGCCSPAQLLAGSPGPTGHPGNLSRAALASRHHFPSCPRPAAVRIYRPPAAAVAYTHVQGSDSGPAGQPAPRPQSRLSPRSPAPLSSSLDGHEGRT